MDFPTKHSASRPALSTGNKWTQRFYLHLELLVRGYIRQSDNFRMPPEMASMIGAFTKKNTLKEGDIHLSIAVIGHAHSGKTTLAAYLALELGLSISSKLPLLTEERDSGHTTTWHTYQFKTDTYDYTLIDLPGHHKFIPNMIRGVSMADVGLLIVPANKDVYEASIAVGKLGKQVLPGQSRQHAQISHLMGVEQLIVCINQMDDDTVKYSEDRYNEIKRDVEKMLTKIGYKTKKIPFIPISALLGDNIMDISANMPWWKGFEVKIRGDRKFDRITGATLYDALQSVVRLPKRAVTEPFRMAISAVHRIKGVGCVVAGRVEQGSITFDQHVTAKFYPTGCQGKVLQMERHHEPIVSAQCGDIIGVNMFGLKHKKDMLPRIGDMMCIDNVKSDPSPPRAVSQFRVLLFVQDHPGKLKSAEWTRNKKTNEIEYKGGYTPSVHVRTGIAPCQMVEISWKMGKSTNLAKVENPEFLEAGDQAEAVFVPQSRFMVLPFDECKPFGRVAMMDSHHLVIVAKVLRVTYLK